MEKHGTCWNKVSEAVPGRSGPQCRERSVLRGELYLAVAPFLVVRSWIVSGSAEPAAIVIRR